jgi:hypothetical protein
VASLLDIAPGRPHLLVERLPVVSRAHHLGQNVSNSERIPLFKSGQIPRAERRIQEG